MEIGELLRNKSQKISSLSLRRTEEGTLLIQLHQILAQATANLELHPRLTSPPQTSISSVQEDK